MLRSLGSSSAGGCGPGVLPRDNQDESRDEVAGGGRSRYRALLIAMAAPPLLSHACGRLGGEVQTAVGAVPQLLMRWHA
jgi:hypothetical protein